MARRRGGFPATLFLSLCLLAAAVLLCSAEEPLGLAADDAPDFAIGDWLASIGGQGRCANMAQPDRLTD